MSRSLTVITIAFMAASLASLLFTPIDTLMITPVYAEQQQQKQQNIYTIIPAVIQNLLTVVSFLIGISSFILGLSIQNAERLTPIMKRYFEILILALVVPSVIIIIYGIILIGSALGPEDADYLIILFSLFVPSAAILFLFSKMHSASSSLLWRTKE